MYRTWANMLRRCENPQDHFYYRYGGRGITVCERWHDVKLFIADIESLLGFRPPGMTLDRKDNDGNYEPGNVRWATNGEQQLNRHRTNPVRIIRDRTMAERIALARDLADKGISLREIAGVLGVSRAAVSVYLRKP